MFAMVAFASNSLLNRAALSGGAIDAVAFTSVRLLSGTAMLGLMVAFRGRLAERRPRGQRWVSALLLGTYAAAFSFSYIRIGAGTGALLLFGSVQIVVYGSAILRGERPGARGWLALAIASTGLAVLVAPGVAAPDAGGASLMLVAGISWGLYTLRGRGVADPIVTTYENFLLAAVLALPLAAVMMALGLEIHAEPRGVLLAVVSGAVTSGLGYALWYSVLPRLTRIQSGIIQLAPPPLAIVGGLALLGESLTLRIGLASLAVFSGVWLGLLSADRVDRGR